MPCIFDKGLQAGKLSILSALVHITEEAERALQAFHAGFSSCCSLGISCLREKKEQVLPQNQSTLINKSMCHTCYICKHSKDISNSFLGPASFCPHYWILHRKREGGQVTPVSCLVPALCWCAMFSRRHITLKVRTRHCCTEAYIHTQQLSAPVLTLLLILGSFPSQFEKSAQGWCAGWEIILLLPTISC